MKNWNRDSWRKKDAQQQPEWPDQNELQLVNGQIAELPPLVFAGEIRSLKKNLAMAQEGKAFLLQGGDCAEEFKSCNAPTIRETLKVILQMAVVLSYSGEKPVIKVGRIAGQYAKPRSKGTETIDGTELPSYRGDIVNDAAFTPEARRPDANRLKNAYWHSSSTLNLLRAFTKGGFADLHRVHAWNQEFIGNSKQGHRYEELAKDIEKALAFLKVIGVKDNHPNISEVDFFTSHEALLLNYEEALTRQDTITKKWYDCSAHMLWIGDRTRQLDGAHVEFLRGVHNPIGMKIGPKHDIDEVKAILNRLNPDNEAGRITLITRFGADKVGDYLPNLLRGIDQEGMKVLWSCDPMHGNTYLANSNYKTRNFDNVIKEIRQFFEIHRSENTIPGGVHLELTGNNVTECIGGAGGPTSTELSRAYESNVDPRLNYDQAMEIAFLIAGQSRENS